MWARTTFRHTLRHSFPLSSGKLALSSGIALSLAAPLTARLFTTASADTPPLAECTRWLVHDASSAAPRECPTPLVLLRVPRLTTGAEAAHDESFRAWADMFAARGYTAVEVDVTVDPNVGDHSANWNGNRNENGNGAAHGASFPEPIASAKSALNARLRLLNIPFAPIVIASGPAGLVAQAYVSDHRASGLVLIDPPGDEDPRKEKTWGWPTFNYEPRFPILLLGRGIEGTRVGQAAKEGVGRGGKGVQIGEVVDGVRGEKTRMEIERWMDRCGW